MLPSSEVLAVAQIAEMELCFFNKTAAHHLLRHVYHHQEKALRSLRCFPRWTHDRGSKLKQDSFLSNKGLLHTLCIAYAMAALRFARKVGMKRYFCDPLQGGVVSANCAIAKPARHCVSQMCFMFCLKQEQLQLAEASFREDSSKGR